MVDKKHIKKLKQMHLDEPSAAPSIQTMDKFDHLYCMFCTREGKARRMDIIVCLKEEWAFAFLGKLLFCCKMFVRQPSITSIYNIALP